MTTTHTVRHIKRERASGWTLAGAPPRRRFRMTASCLGYEVSCDGPADGIDRPHSAAVCARTFSRTAAEVRVDGHHQGWERPRRGPRLVDLCPDCRSEPAR